MANCVRNSLNKNYHNLVIGFQVTVENVGDTFLGHSILWRRLWLYTAGIQLVSPVSSSSSSRFTTPSPAPLSSPLSSSTSPRYLPQSVLSGDGARPLPLFEHIRRLRNGAGGVRHHPALPVAGNY